MTSVWALVMVAGLIAVGAAIFLRSKRKPSPRTYDFPQYVAKPCDGLPLGGRLVIEIDAIGPFAADATVTPFFQRAGDNWTTLGEFETYRWWASFATIPLVPGHHVLDVPFDANWTATQTSSRDSNPAAYAEALRNAYRAGFTIGDVTGLGHGDNPPGTLTVRSIAIHD